MTPFATIGAAFDAACRTWPEQEFLAAPGGGQTHPDGFGLTYTGAAAYVATLVSQFRTTGYGVGHRVAVNVASRPEHLLIKLALNTIGASIVPINPDYRAGEIAYLLSDADPALVITEADRMSTLGPGIEEAGYSGPLAMFDGVLEDPGEARSPESEGQVTAETEASLIYTSGSTGRPKGCILSHECELSYGQTYLDKGGLLSPVAGARLFNPLPLFHVNAGMVSFFAMLLSGGCQIQPERFDRATWWQDLRDTKADVFHYLGIVIPALLANPPSAGDKTHGARLGVGAGVEPTLHRVFEERFNTELVEVWGMSEACRVLSDCAPPTQPDTRAIGRPFPGLQARIVDDADQDVATGTPGELILRHSQETPRRGFFSGYLGRPDLTEESWRGGWFHTGDTMCQDQTGMIYFVDRKKNIIRRSGENIAAAEVEAVLLDHPAVEQAAVLSVADERRDEEVLACLVTSRPGTDTLAREIFDHVYQKLSYYKAPAWVVFRDALPVTGTQKILKHMIFPEGFSPGADPEVIDFRSLKTRVRSA